MLCLQNMRFKLYFLGMTPAKRRKLFRAILILILVMLSGVAGRFLFRGESLPYLLLGRKPGSQDPGSLLVRSHPAAPNSNNALNQTTSPTTLKFNLLGGWKYIEGKTSIPKNVRDFDGKSVEISGFMMPINETEHIKRFLLIQSLWGCCFGQTPEVNHIIVVDMESDKTAEYYPDPVVVTGKFSVGETREEGYLVSIYRLQASKVVVQ